MKSKKDLFRSALIFGGAGFIGSNWAYYLMENTDAKVHVFDNLSRKGVRHNLDWLQTKAGNSGRLQITVGDVRDAAMVERAVRSATEIYHFAAQVAVTTSLTDPRLDFDINLGGTFNILEAVRKSGRRPFLLFTSTNKVYGELRGRAMVVTGSRRRFADSQGVAEDQPLDFHSPYGCSKGAADQYVRDYARMFDIPAVVFRMSCIAGPRQFGTEDQGWIAHFLYTALADQPVVVYGDGRQLRDVLSVKDLMRAIEAARQNPQVCAGEIYNVGGGPQNTISLLELIAAIAKLTGRNLETVFEQRRPGDQLVYVSDFSKLQRDTGWSPAHSPLETLEQIYEWWKHNRQLFLKPAAAKAARVSAVLQQLPRTA
jgi:CDP-paratose 2-epimerase